MKGGEYVYKVVKVETISTGKRLSNLLEEKGLTQEKFAGMIGKNGVSVQSVSAWVNDKAKIRKNTLIQIAEILDVDVDYLLCKSITPRANISKAEFSNIQSEDELVEQLQSIKEFEKLREYLEIIGFKIEDVFGSPQETGDSVQFQFIENGKIYTVEEQLTEPSEMKKVITYPDLSTQEIADSDYYTLLDSIKKYILFQLNSIKK